MNSILKTFGLLLCLVANLAMGQANCLFCKIVNRQEPAKIIAENADVLVFESIRPVHPSHWIIIPKKHEPDIKSMTDASLMGNVFMAASDLGKQLDGAQAFNLQVNNGAAAGQTVFHFHVHFKSQNQLTTATPKI
ncbi:histidine triad nucleotide-binding protein [soil metagenome]